MRNLSTQISSFPPILAGHVPLSHFLHARHFSFASRSHLGSRVSGKLRGRACAIISAEQFMSERTVFCAKLKQQLPGLPEPPFDSDLGNKIYEQVSQQAWGQWMEHCKMLLNEYRLNPARKQDQEVIVKQMEQFFFGDGAAPPKEYVTPSH
jgi:Fe-S cluster biosynthesis and repair protein YggX